MTPIEEARGRVLSLVATDLEKSRVAAGQDSAVNVCHATTLNMAILAVATAGGPPVAIMFDLPRVESLLLTLDTVAERMRATKQMVQDN